MAMLTCIHLHMRICCGVSQELCMKGVAMEARSTMAAAWQFNPSPYPPWSPAAMGAEGSELPMHRGGNPLS